MKKLPILPPYKNIDKTTITNSMREIIDGIMIVDQESNVSLQRRPGLRKLKDLSEGARIDLHWFDSISSLIAVTNGKCYVIPKKDFSEVNEIIGVNLIVNQKVIFDEVYDVVNAETRLFMANGGAVYWTNGVNAGTLTGNNAPSRCTHIAQIDTYLLCNDLDKSAQFLQSVVNDPTNFDSGSGSRTYAAQRIPDDVIALFGKNNKIYVCGRESIEIWYNVGDTIPFAPVGTIISTGLASPYSYGILYDNVIFLNSDRQPVYLNGYTPVYIGEAYQKEFDSLGPIRDAEATFVSTIGGRQYWIISFTDQNKTFVYDTGSKAWYRWGNWNNTDHDRFLAASYAYCKDWGFHVMGDLNDSIVYEFSPDYYKDNNDAMQTILLFGNYDLGSKNYKVSKKLLVDIKRGEGKSDDKYSAPKAYISWSDNDTEIFGNDVELDLGAIGKREKFGPLMPMGYYKTRTYRIVFGDNANIVFNGFWEDARETSRSY